MTSGAWNEDRVVLDGLAMVLAQRVGATELRIERAERLAGGAVQESWRLDVVVTGGALAGSHRWVLRADAAARLPVSLDRGTELEVIAAAHRAGVLVAKPIAHVGPDNPIGAAFLVTGWLAGHAQARGIVRHRELAQHGEGLARSLAGELARVHAISPGNGRLSCLPIPTVAPARMEVARLRGALDKAGEPRPALEYVLGWLDGHAPPARALVLVHGDFRTGNYMVADGRLTGILDWEFAHWGDPDEDIGWLTARCWRFGNDELEAGGIARLDPFLAAYGQASGRKVSADAVAYWQIMAAAKWAAIAVLQGDRYRRGGEERLELALTGLMAPEMEHDALSAILAWRKGQDGGPTWR